MIKTRLFQSLLQIGAFKGLDNNNRFFEQLASVGQVVGLVETWQATAVKISGVLLVDTTREIEVADFRVSIGLKGAQALPIPFAFELPRTPVALLLAGMSLRAGLLDLESAIIFFGQQIVNDTKAFISQQINVFDTVSLSLGPLSIFLGLPTDWFVRGQYVRSQAGEIIGVEPLPEDLPVTIALGSANLKLSIHEIDLDFDGSDSFQAALFLIRGTGIALEVGQTQFFSATEEKPDFILRKTGFDSSWSGVSLKSLKVWGLETIFPAMASGAESTVVALEDWLIDGRGITGSVVAASPSTQTETIQIDELQFEFDRTWWPVALELTGNVDLGTWVGAEPKRLDATTSLRINPKATDIWARYSLEVFLTPEPNADAIVRLDQGLTELGATAAAIAALTNSTDITLMLGALAALDTAGVMTWQTLALTAAQLRLAFVSSGTDREASLVLTGQLALAAKVAFEVDSQDAPVAVELDTGELSFTWDITAAEIRADWTLKQGFGISIPAVIDIGGILVIDRVGIALEGVDALRIEFGVQPAGTGEVAIAGLPDVFGFIYRPGGSPEIEPFIRREAQPLVLLVPGVLYASGTLSRGGAGHLPGGGSDWGDVLQGRVRAFLIGNGTAIEPADYLKKESYTLDLDIAILMATRASDGLQAVVVTLDAGFRPGIPLGTSGVSLYGLGLTYAQNARPDADEGDFASWFMDKPEAFSTNALKWIPAADNWGFGAAVTLGSAPDIGTAFNVAAGLFLLLPGPVVLITGKANVFDVLPKLPAEIPEGEPKEDVKAAFAATVVLDFLRDRFEVDMRADVEKTLGPVTLLDISAPSELSVDLKNPQDFHLYLGEAEPPSARATAKGLNIPDLNAYLMLDGQGLTLPPEALALPGLALAMGAQAGFDKGFTFGPLSLRLDAAIGFDLALALDLPPLARGQAYANGMLMARAFGVGAYLEAGITFQAVAPSPFSLKGEAHVRIEMPWFVPDIDVQAELEIGSGGLIWPDNYPLPVSANPVEQLAFVVSGQPPTPITRLSENVTSNVPTITQDVPVDAGLFLIFNVPMGNEQAKIGSVTTNGADRGAPVWVVTTSGNDANERIGHRYTLTAITLTEAGDVPVETIAKWTRPTHAGNQPGRDLPRTKGGIVDRSSLQLLTVDQDDSVRLSGQAKIILEKYFSALDPCERAPRLKQLISTYTLEQKNEPIVFKPSPVIPDRRDVLPSIKHPVIKPKLPNSPRPKHPLLRRENRDLSISDIPTFGIPANKTRPVFDKLKLSTRRVQPLTFGQQYRFVNDADASEPAIMFEVLPPEIDAILLRSIGQGRTRPAASYDVRIDIASPLPPAAEQKPLLQLPIWLIHQQSLPTDDNLEKTLTAFKQLALANGNPAGSVHLKLPRLAEAELCLAVWKGATLIAEETDTDGQRRILQSDLVSPSEQNAHRVFLPGTDHNHTVEWRVHRLRTSKRASELTISAAAILTTAIETTLARVALPLVGLMGVRLIAEPPQVIAALERATSSYRNMLNTVITQQNDWLAGGSAGLLKPDTEYKLTVSGTLQAARQQKDGELKLDGPVELFTDSFMFHTAKAPTGLLTPYRGPVNRDGSLAISGNLEDNWQIAVTPSEAGPRHYLDSGISLRFRKARPLGAINAYGLFPLLRLKSEAGDSSEFSPTMSLRPATDLQPDEAALRQRHLSTPCYNIDIHREVVMDIAADLLPNTRYEAMFVASSLGNSLTNGTADNETTETLLHRWHFITSRFANFRQHVEAHQIVDEVFPDTGHRLLSQAIKMVTFPLTLDSVALDNVLFNILSLPSRPSPKVPEIARLWSWDPTNNQVVLRALLLDGPESLIATGDQLTLLQGTRPSVLPSLSDALGARALVITNSLPPGNYQFRLTKLDGSSATLSLMVPSRPAILEVN